VLREEVAQLGDRRVLLLDSISQLEPGDEGRIVVSASHGGVSSGEYAVGLPLAAVFFNDAGVGKDAAGIAALEMLERRGVPAGTYSHDTARIGDARDAWNAGVLSHVNAPAYEAGLRVGAPVRAAVRDAFAATGGREAKGEDVSQRFLLSIDGGGVRGIIPAVALAKLETTTGRLTREIFSFVAGTSTGAVIAAGVAAGIPASRIVDLYMKRAHELFTGPPLLNVMRRVVTGSMYSTKTLHELIAEELGEARDLSVNDAPVDLLITAKGLPDGRPWYFVKDNPANSRCTGRLRVADCATASSAAPTYFQPWAVDEDDVPSRCEPIGALVDGGVGVAGNPVYQACVEAFYYTDGTNAYIPGETTTVSIGTGRSIAPKQLPTWIGSWLRWVLGELLESPGEQQTEIAWRHFVRDRPEGDKMRFYRIDAELKERIPLDGVRSINRLREYGEELAELIDWKAVLAGTDETFRVDYERTSFPQYAKEVP
jgi:hypothetical protein